MSRIDPYEFATVAALIAIVLVIFAPVPGWLQIILWAIAVSGGLMAIRGLWR